MAAKFTGPSCSAATVSQLRPSAWETEYATERGAGFIGAPFFFWRDIEAAPRKSGAVMLYIRYPLSLRQIEDILFERGIDTPV